MGKQEVQRQHLVETLQECVEDALTVLEDFDLIPSHRVVAFELVLKKIIAERT